MDRRFRNGLIVLAGLTLLGTALGLRALLVEPAWWTLAVGGAGIALAALGGYAIRADLVALGRGRRGEIALYTAGAVGVLVVLAYLSVRYPFRFDLTSSQRYSLSAPTVTMLEKLDRPVHVVFFHDPMMRETVELYELIAKRTPRVTVEFYDPVISPAQARMRGVQFAGTAVLESEGRRLQVHGGSETDIANGILRVSRSATQRVCFLEGHGEPDPFSLESHDHLEGAPGHSHGLGANYVLHERHGMAKARHALETLNYQVEKVLLLQGREVLAGCAVLVVPGPKVTLLPIEVAAVRRYLEAGGNAFFMLDPFVRTGLEPLVRDYGVVLDDDIVIDEASHFWADMSSPAVTDYNRHQVTRELPLTFFPGVRSLSPTRERVPDTAVLPLVSSSKKSWGQANRERLGFVPGRDQAGPRTLMVLALRRGAEEGPGPRRSRIAVIGDSDFATNSFFHIMGNGTLFLSTINYLAAQESLIGITPVTHDLPRVNLTNRQMKGTFFLAIVVVPAALSILGTAVWWRQR
jgi:hypothetical protein